MADDPVKAKGLLDVAIAEANGLAWQPDKENFGLGLGATEDARRWVELGHFFERYLRAPRPAKRGPGQPSKNPTRTNDAKRALVIYLTLERVREVKEIKREAKFETPLRTLIELAEDTFPTHGLFNKPKAQNKMLASVKRGREILGIDEHWRGPPIDELRVLVANEPLK
ncbi:hypothetical protein PVV74_13750 [Roseovarius sp. SK2]|uniref:hypothetical protein n=1 Tax=Roseovarius TaxID=74030 RepID=UPI00237A74F5|nr:hypothetical protein [Roseovarius sp. SK2]MDD9726529.1 hypothetical protein [Roseovarius sp. SK2]